MPAMIIYIYPPLRFGIDAVAHMEDTDSALQDFRVKIDANKLYVVVVTILLEAL